MQTLPSQRALLALSAQYPGSSAFNVVAVWRRRGPIDGGALVAAATAAVSEAQAYELGAVQRSPVDVALVRVAPAPVEVVEFDSESEYAQWLDRVRDTPFALDGAPLTRVAVARVGGDHAVVLSAHHVAVDGYGVALVFRRIAERYEAAVAGRELGYARLGDLDGVAAEAADPAEGPDLDFWSTALDGVGDPGREFWLSTRVAPPAERPHRLSAPVEVPGTRDRWTWPSETVGAIGAYVARHLDSDEASIGVVTHLRRTPLEKTTPMQWMSVTPARLRFTPSTTPVDAGAAVREWLAVAAERVRLGDRPETLLSAVPSAWRVGRVHGPIVNILPYVGGGPWSLDVKAWGPVEDCLINVVRGDGDRLSVDGVFHPDLYDEATARTHVEAVARFLAGTLAEPGAPFDYAPVPVRSVAPDRVPIPGGYAAPGEVRAALAGVGFDGDRVELRIDRGLTVVLHDGDEARLHDARAVLPRGVRVRLA